MAAAMRMQQEKPQKVRQVVVPHGLDSLFTSPVVPAGAISGSPSPATAVPSLATAVPSPAPAVPSPAPAETEAALGISVVDASGAAPAASGSAAPAGDEGSARQDLPRFSRDRSLRRQLDAAFESCHRSSMAGWFEGLLQGLLGK